MEKSKAIDVCRDPGESALALFRTEEIVGSDNSSATNGSSVAIVAEKNLCPTNPWAMAVQGEMVIVATAVK